MLVLLWRERSDSLWSHTDGGVQCHQSPHQQEGGSQGIMWVLLVPTAGLRCPGAGIVCPGGADTIGMEVLGPFS